MSWVMAALGMNSAQACPQRTYEVGLRGFLESEDRGRLEAKVSLEVLGNLANEALKGSLRMSKSVLFWYLLIR